MSEVRGLLQAIAVVKNSQKLMTKDPIIQQTVRIIVKNLVNELDRTLNNERNFTDWGLGRSQTVSLIREYQLECLECASDELKAKRDNITTADPEYFKGRDKLLAGIIEAAKELVDPTIVNQSLIKQAHDYCSALCNLNPSWPRED